MNTPDGATVLRRIVDPVGPFCPHCVDQVRMLQSAQYSDVIHWRCPKCSQLITQSRGVAVRRTVEEGSNLPFDEIALGAKRRFDAHYARLARRDEAEELAVVTRARDRADAEGPMESVRIAIESLGSVEEIKRAMLRLPEFHCVGCDTGIERGEVLGWDRRQLGDREIHEGCGHPSRSFTKDLCGPILVNGAQLTTDDLVIHDVTQAELAEVIRAGLEGGKGSDTIAKWICERFAGRRIALGTPSR